jgi:signal transduction histidine kinase
MRQGGWFRRGVRCVAGLSLGAVMAAMEVGFLALACAAYLPTLAWPDQRARVERLVYDVAHRLAELDRHRIARYLSSENATSYTPRRAFQYVAVRWLVGGLGGLVLGLLAFGLAVAISMLSAWLLGEDWAFIEDGGRVTMVTIAAVTPPGALLLYLNVMGVVGVADLERRTARHFLGPSARELLERRVSELAISRAEVVQAVNDERRRIERDLHDGVQQRLVALGMLLGRARRSPDPDRAASLLRQAHEESQQALNDLREVAWRVYPTVLDQVGLRDVLTELASRSALAVQLRYELDGRAPATVETVAYFVVSEAVSNAAKHSGAGRVEIVVNGNDQEVEVQVTDDGKGGADPGGRGLLGLAGRVAATDGRFTVTSPEGGPTVVRAVLPCE